MKNKLTNCATCGAEIAKSAKACPHCGAKQKKKHPILIGIVLLFVLFAIIGSSSSDEPKKVESSTTAKNIETAVSETEESNSKPKAEEKTAFYVGETAELKGVSVTLASISESDGSSYNYPSDGNVFILCEFEIENNSDKEITVSSMMSFEAYCDDYTCNISLNALLEKDNKNQLDGTVAAGKKFNGVVGYEIPEDWKEFEIIFTPDFWSGKDITFIAVNN